MILFETAGTLLVEERSHIRLGLGWSALLAMFRPGQMDQNDGPEAHHFRHFLLNGNNSMTH